jgi:CubicO group peptidase (beta-lactamase class C family)
MSALPRRRLLQAAALMLCLPRPAEAAALIRDAVRRLLAERLRHEGVGLAVARFDGAAIDLAAAGPTGLAGEAIDVARHRFEIGSITKTLVGVLLAETVESLLPDG